MHLALLDSTWDWLQFAAARLPELWFLTGQHLVLTGISTGLAVAVGLPLGMLASTRPSWRTAVLAAIGVLQTIPSLAMLAILLAMIGKIGTLPATIALTIYALLPIVRNTVTGIEGVASDVVEAARGIGMTRWQQLRMAQIPLAMPVMIAGIRTAAVVGVGIATLSAFIGAGGLGQFINRGLALSNMRLILLGAIPAALLAVLVDASIAAAEWGMKPGRQSARRGLKTKLKPLAVASPLLLFACGVFAAFGGRSPNVNAAGPPIRIATKDFAEQLILGELMAQMIEAHTDLTVERRFNLGGTMICHDALAAGEIDLYAEYTGTGLVTVLKQPVESDADEVFRTVRGEYERRFGLAWLEPFGFNNTYALTVREADARRRGWRTISDLTASAGRLRAGFTAEFSARPDGYPSVRKAYGLDFGEVHDLQPSLMYQAVATGEVDVVGAFTTDGRIAAFDLFPLADDRNAFPPYFAAPVIRGELLKRHPDVRDVLARLAGVLDDATMQRLNYDVDEHGRRPSGVARDFLVEQGLLKRR